MALNCVVSDRDLLPVRGTPGAAAVDLFSASKEDIVIESLKRARIGTGVAMAIPQGCFGKIEARSSMGAQGIIVLGSIVDSDYRGVIEVMLLNMGEVPYIVKYGRKIAQIIIQPCVLLQPVMVDALDSTLRGAAGFGSTGK